MRSTPYITLLVCLWLIASPNLRAQEIQGSNQPAPDEEIIRVETNLVSIPVSVRDRKGRFVTDLRLDDFQIFENGTRQAVAHFAPIDQLFSVVLLIDTSGSTQIRLKDIQDSAIAFVEQIARTIVCCPSHSVTKLSRSCPASPATARLCAQPSGEHTRDSKEVQPARQSRFAARPTR